MQPCRCSGVPGGRSLPVRPRRASPFRRRACRSAPKGFPPKRCPLPGRTSRQDSVHGYGSGGEPQRRGKPGPAAHPRLPPGPGTSRLFGGRRQRGPRPTLHLTGPGPRGVTAGRPGRGGDTPPPRTRLGVSDGSRRRWAVRGRPSRRTPRLGEAPRARHGQVGGEASMGRASGRDAIGLGEHRVAVLGAAGGARRAHPAEGPDGGCPTPTLRTSGPAAATVPVHCCPLTRGP